LIRPDLPLVELHRHLDGSVRLQTILDLGIQYNLKLPAYDLEGLRLHVQVTTPQPGVMAFISKFEWMVGILVNEEAVRRIAYESVEDACNEGLDYVELRFSPMFMAAPHRLDPVAVVTAVIDGVVSAQHDFGTRANLIGIISRTYGPDRANEELTALLSNKNAITAIDLAGDEANFPAEWFSSHFQRARDAGWHVTVHAGESAGPESIWQALNTLGAERIGHAIRALEDQKLLEHLEKKQIGIESCLTSNVQTSCIPDYASHPIKRFLELGICATINTDDPGISGITLPYEYNHAAPLAGLSGQQICQAQNNALDAAFLTDTEKSSILSAKLGH
jgi:adenosine deaminase